MAEPYLIAHLVRGEPAFDIAIRLQIGDEEGWIIPTSGHRAWPYWEYPLHELHKKFGEEYDSIAYASGRSSRPPRPLPNPRYPHRPSRLR